MINSLNYKIIFFVQISLFFYISAVGAEQIIQKSSDLSAPKISHANISKVYTAGESVKITANVTDDSGVKTVDLYFRRIGEQAYEKLPMQRQNNSGNYFIEFNKIQRPGIEYYIQAEDHAGNSLLHGSSVSPWVVSVTDIDSTRSTASASAKQTSKSTKQKQWGNNTVRGGVSVGPDAFALLVDYEHIFKNFISVGARVGDFAYTYEENSYTEDGTGVGAEATVRFYPQKQGLQGFYLGGSVGFWAVEWDWEDPTDSPTQGTGTSAAMSLAFNLGWKFHFGQSRAYIEPNLILGQFVSLTTETDVAGDEDEAELGFYALLGVSFGATF